MKEISAALTKAQAGFKTAVFDSVNPHFKSSYASLNSVFDAVKAALSVNGLAVIQGVVVEGGANYLQTTLIHTSGETVSGLVPLIVAKNDMQGLGSSLTYARRYGLSALLGIVSDTDDDGNNATPPPPVKPSPQKAPQPSAQKPPMTTSGAKCLTCSNDMIMSKSGAGYYCPNFKDTTNGEHSRCKVNELADFIAKQNVEMDVPF